MSFISDLFSHDESAALAGLGGEQAPIPSLGTPVGGGDEAHGGERSGPGAR
ncbi:MAG: hypothetical protein HY996_06765 [Micrococcales bacterium]|nr:hypothetical protein [Micrococcales bacterium]